MLVDAYSLRRAAEVTDLSLAMADYLCRTGVLVPTAGRDRGRGRKRLYSFGDVVMLRVISKLLKAGVEVARLKESLEKLRQYHPEITPTSLPAGLLVTDGRHVYLRAKGEALENLVTGQLTFAFVVELADIQREMFQRLSASDERQRAAA